MLLCKRPLAVLVALSLPLSTALANDFATVFSNKQDTRREPQAEPSLTIRKLFVFPGNDDVGNVIAPELDMALTKNLEKNSRFQVIRNQKVADALKMDDKGYGRVVVSPEVHSKAARLAGADTTVVLESRHVGQELKIKEDWRRADGSILFSETHAISAKSGINEQKKAVDFITDNIVKRIPFKGTVTGRTGNVVTLDLNQDQVNVGDRVTIARLVSTKEHPLLKTLVNIDYVNVGTAEVTSVDNVLAFARVTGEASGEEISVENKVINVDQYVNGVPAGRRGDTGGDRGGKDKGWNNLEKYEKANADPLGDDETLTGDFERIKARYGLLGAKVHFGNIAHSETVSGTNTEISGSGFGAGFLGEAWITKNWIAVLTYDFMSAGLKGTRAGAPLAITGVSWNKLDIYGAYRYLTEDTLDGTFITFGLGYESVKMNLPLDAVNSLGKKSYSGILVAITGDIALDKTNRVEAFLGLQPFSSFQETEFTSGTPDGGNAVNVAARWQWAWKPTLYLSAGVDYNVANGSILNGKNLTEKRFSISPGLKYLF